MKTYHIECMETNSFIVEVEAQSEDEARELAHEDINSCLLYTSPSPRDRG